MNDISERIKGIEGDPGTIPRRHYREIEEDIKSFRAVRIAL